MLKALALRYYLKKDCNCAESVLKAANKCYDLKLDSKTIRAMGGFGGGCCAGRLCGTCAAGVAAISSKYIRTRAHKEEEACGRVEEFVNYFIEQMGSDLCDELKDLYWKEEYGSKRCRDTVALAADVLEAKMAWYMCEDMYPVLKKVKKKEEEEETGEEAETEEAAEEAEGEEE